MTLIPTQMTFRGLALDEALEGDVRERVSWLEQFYRGIVRCRVLVEVPHRHRHDGRHFHVRIELTVPGGPPIVVSHEPHHLSERHRKATTRDSIHDAFKTAEEQLKDFKDQRKQARPKGLIRKLAANL